MNGPQSTEPFFQFLKDVLTLGMKGSQKKLAHLVVGAVLYAGVIGLVVVTLAWLDTALAVSAAIVAVILTAVMILLLLLGPNLNPAVRNTLAMIVVVGLLATLMFGAYQIAAAVGHAAVFSRQGAIAQLTGDVLFDSASTPVANTRVFVPGTSFGDVTNSQGRFAFEVPRESFRNDSIWLAIDLPGGRFEHRYARADFPVRRMVVPLPSPAPLDTGEEGAEGSTKPSAGPPSVADHGALRQFSVSGISHPALVAEIERLAANRLPGDGSGTRVNIGHTGELVERTAGLWTYTGGSLRVEVGGQSCELPSPITLPPSPPLGNSRGYVENLVSQELVNAVDRHLEVVAGTVVGCLS